MALTERQRARLRGVVDMLLRSEETVERVAGEAAHDGNPETDAVLDQALQQVRQAVAALTPLVGGAGRPPPR
ncbi:MAG: hypothetical protein U0531_11250 [Dehalococcoidia bacterium]